MEAFTLIAMTGTETMPIGAATPDEQRWQAVLARDAAAKGRFVCGVTSTGVYCRPTCPSRRPKRENAVFFDTGAEAVRAGYRACKRCRPDEAASHPQAEAVAEACRLIETAEEPPKLEALAEAAGLSPWHFHRVFKDVTGVTPKDYAASHRAARLRAGLAEASSVTAALYDAGFNASSRFYAAASDALGMTPSAYRRGGAGEHLRVAIATTSLGEALVAATEKGVAAIEFGDDAEALLKGFQDRFPKAELITDDADFDRLVASVIGAIERPGSADLAALPLDLRGTAFQHRVWQALRRIPLGETASYAEVAEAIGAPGSARAVAKACATNNVAVVVPCHRVVRQDGALSGYRWGVERKRVLLAREKTA